MNDMIFVSVSKMLTSPGRDLIWIGVEVPAISSMYSWLPMMFMMLFMASPMSMYVAAGGVESAGCDRRTSFPRWLVVVIALKTGRIMVRLLVWRCWVD